MLFTTWRGKLVLFGIGKTSDGYLLLRFYGVDFYDETTEMPSITSVNYSNSYDTVFTDTVTEL